MGIFILPLKMTGFECAEANLKLYFKELERGAFHPHLLSFVHYGIELELEDNAPPLEESGIAAEPLSSLL